MTEKEIQVSIELLFRQEAGRLISVLTRLFGPQNLELAEGMLQELFVAAVGTWSREGIPDNPSA